MEFYMAPHKELALVPIGSVRQYINRKVYPTCISEPVTFCGSHVGTLNCLCSKGELWANRVHERIYWQDRLLNVNHVSAAAALLAISRSKINPHYHRHRFESECEWYAAGGNNRKNSLSGLFPSLLPGRDFNAPRVVCATEATNPFMGRFLTIQQIKRNEKLGPDENRTNAASVAAIS